MQSGDAYTAGVEGTENGVVACAGVEGVEDRPGSECRWSVKEEENEADVDAEDEDV